MDWKRAYYIGMTATAWPVAFATFLVCWGFAIAKFGWVLGLALGWIPALIAAGVLGYAAGILWPLLVVMALPALFWFVLLAQ